MCNILHIKHICLKRSLSLWTLFWAVKGLIKSFFTEPDLLFHSRSYCLPNYYNVSCEVFCVNQDESSGRYTCNTTTGAKICIEGWFGDNCNHGNYLKYYKYYTFFCIKLARDVILTSIQRRSNVTKWNKKVIVYQKIPSLILKLLALISILSLESLEFEIDLI